MNNSGGDKQQQWNYKEWSFLITQPKTIICEAQAIRTKLKRIKLNDRSSKEERKVNALALRADEGRDYLR